MGYQKRFYAMVLDMVMQLDVICKRCPAAVLSSNIDSSVG